MRPNLLFSFVLTLALTLFASSAVFASLQEDVNEATNIIRSFDGIAEQGIPKEVLQNAKGVAVLTVYKAGFMFSGRGGTGVVVAKTRDGWSGPSAIGTGGAGFGFQIGAKATDFVIVLNSDAAVDAFARGTNVELGAALSVAAGPVGRTAEAGVLPVAAVYTYSRSKGLFAGVSLEGTVIAARNEANTEYYGQPVTPVEILTGRVAPPPGARPLQLALSRAEGIYARGPR